MTDITTSAPETGAAEPSIRDVLNANFEKSQAGTLDAPETPARPADAASEGAKPSGATDDRPRGPDGKFIAKDDTGAEKTETPSPTKMDGKDAAPPAGDKTAQPAADKPAGAVEAPQHWPQADRDMFAKQAPEAQKWLLDRHKAMETDYTRKTEGIAPLLQEIDRASPYLRSINATPEAAFQALLSTEYTLRHGTPDQKVAAVQRILNDYKITLPGSTSRPTETPAAGEQSAADQSEWEDPAVAALRKEIADLKQAEQQRQQLTAAEMEQRAISELRAFEAEKTADGKPAYPHFASVIDEMTRLALVERAQGRQPNLKSLYEVAVYANPATRAQLLADQQAEQQRKIEAEIEAKRKAQEAETKAKAEQARKASASVTGAPRGGIASDGSGKPIRQIMEESLAAQAGRL